MALISSSGLQAECLSGSRGQEGRRPARPSPDAGPRKRCAPPLPSARSAPVRSSSASDDPGNLSVFSRFGPETAVARDLRRGGTMPAVMEDPDRVRLAYEERVRTLQAALDKRELELGILSEVAAAIHGEEDVGRILDVALDRVLAGLRLQTAWVFMGDEREGQLHLAASRGVDPELPRGDRAHGPRRLPVPGGLLDRAPHAGPQHDTVPADADDRRGPDGSRGPRLHPAALRRATAGRAEHRGTARESRSPTRSCRFLETVGQQVCIAVERGAPPPRRAAAQPGSPRHGGHQQVHRRLPGRESGPRGRGALGSRDRRAPSASRSSSAAIPTASPVANLVGSATTPNCGKGRRWTSTRSALPGHCQGPDRARGPHGERLADVIDGWPTSWAAMATGAALLVPLLDPQADPRPHRPHPRRALRLERRGGRRGRGPRRPGLGRPRERPALRGGPRARYQDLKDAQQRILQAEKLAVRRHLRVRARPRGAQSAELHLPAALGPRAPAGPGGPARPEELRRSSSVIRDEIRRLDSLVGDFLMFSRTNRIQYTPASLDVPHRQRRPSPAPRGPSRRGSRCAASASVATCPTTADRQPRQMKQVVINLVRNAIEAMPDGGAASSSRAASSTAARGSSCGTAARGSRENIDVFQLFVTTKDKGTGLGLSIAQQIVLEHGGEITASSDPGRGSDVQDLAPQSGLRTRRTSRGGSRDQQGTGRRHRRRGQRRGGARDAPHRRRIRGRARERRARRVCSSSRRPRPTSC